MNVDKVSLCPYHIVFRLMAQIVAIAALLLFFFPFLFRASGTAGYISVELIGIIIIYAYHKINTNHSTPLSGILSAQTSNSSIIIELIDRALSEDGKSS